MGLSDGSKQAFHQIFSAATNLLFNLHHLAKQQPSRHLTRALLENDEYSWVRAQQAFITPQKGDNMLPFREDEVLPSAISILVVSFRMDLELMRI